MPVVSCKKSILWFVFLVVTASGCGGSRTATGPLGLKLVPMSSNPSVFDNFAMRVVIVNRSSTAINAEVPEFVPNATIVFSITRTPRRIKTDRNGRPYHGSPGFITEPEIRVVTLERGRSFDEDFRSSDKWTTLWGEEIKDLIQTERIRTERWYVNGAALVKIRRGDTRGTEKEKSTWIFTTDDPVAVNFVIPAEEPK